MRIRTSPSGSNRLLRVRVVVRRTVRKMPASAGHLRGVARRTLRAGRRTGAVALSISFVGDRKMRSLNRSFAGNDHVTDVLSFPALEGAPPAQRQRGAATDFGDVIICLPQAERQARAARHSLKGEVDLLLTHGILHLLGFDHDTPGHRAAMDRAQAHALRAP